MEETARNVTKPDLRHLPFRGAGLCWNDPGYIVYSSTNSAVIGYISYCYVFDPPVPCILLLEIHEKMQRKGYGRLLVQHMLDQLKKQKTDKTVLTAATGQAAAFYIKLGFKVDKNYPPFTHILHIA